VRSHTLIAPNYPERPVFSAAGLPDPAVTVNDIYAVLAGLSPPKAGVTCQYPPGDLSGNAISFNFVSFIKMTMPLTATAR
jgi:hypothetical protein